MAEQDDPLGSEEFKECVFWIINDCENGGSTIPEAIGAMATFIRKHAAAVVASFIPPDQKFPAGKQIQARQGPIERAAAAALGSLFWDADGDGDPAEGHLSLESVRAAGALLTRYADEIEEAVDADLKTWAEKCGLMQDYLAYKEHRNDV